jgi:acetylornithine deacetylase
MDYVKSIDGWVKAHRDELLKQLAGLIRTRTDNTPPTGREKAGQEYLQRLLTPLFPERDLDLFEIDDVPGIREHPLYFTHIDGIERQYRDRPNFVARLPGKGGGNSLALSGHMDSVPVTEDRWQVFPDPYSGGIKDGRMYGRGVADMKAGTFSGFAALRCLKELGVSLKGDLYAESVVDEEYGGVNGTIACRLRYPDTDFAILSEPSGLTATIETAGGSIWKASVEESGPGGYAQKTNPIYKLGEIIHFLHEYDRQIYKKLAYPPDYKGQRDLELMPFLVHAGGRNYLENASYIPKSGCIYFYLPVLFGQEEQDVRRQFTDFMNRHLRELEDFKEGLPKFETVLRWLEPHKTDVRHPGMQAVRESYRQLGLAYEEKALSLPCDAFSFRRTGKTEVVVIGPNGGNYHGIDEYVEVESVFELIRIMATTAVLYCS